MNSSHSFSQSSLASPHGSGGGRGRPRSFPRAPSVHGGAGGMRVSFSFTPPSRQPPGGSLGSGKGSSLLGGNGKETMQNLNDRLASYLEKVRALEEANTQLESRILEWHQQREPGSKRDYSQYEESISHLQEQRKRTVMGRGRKGIGENAPLAVSQMQTTKPTAPDPEQRKTLIRLQSNQGKKEGDGAASKAISHQIVDGKMTNAQIVVLIDNARMAVDDFSLKYENEHSFKKDLEIEVEGLRKTLDNLTIVTTDLEQEVEGMRKELILMKKRHEQEMEEHQVPHDFKVNVKVDTTPGEDLMKVLEDMRQEYEFIIKKKHQELDTWFKEQSAAMSQEVAGPAAVQSSHSDIHELRRTLQALEIDLQAQHNRKSALENMLSETQSRYTCQLQDMQQVISHYEEELMQLRHDLERQNNEYKVLLGIKTHLEKEIATYRQLLEGDSEGAMEESESSVKAAVASKIKAITQETINGRLVHSQVNEIQKNT